MNRSANPINLASALLILVGIAAPYRTLAATHQDPKALAVVEALEKAIEPDNGWSKAGGLRFTFSVVKDGTAVSEVHHSWNVWSGQYRVDWKTAEGDQRLAMFNVGAKGKQGEAYMRMNLPNSGQASEAEPEGKPARPDVTDWTRTPPAMERQLLETAYGRFINDTYWLLMPLKMRDPGVNLDYDGEKKIDKQTYDVVKLTFDHVGLTPGDTYWVYVNRDTHLIDRWEYVLEHEVAQPDSRKSGSKEGKGADEKANVDSAAAKTESASAESAASAASEPPKRTVWIWKDWQSFGSVKLATTKTKADGSLSIILKNIDVLPSMPENEFQPPKKPSPPHPKAPDATKKGS